MSGKNVFRFSEETNIAQALEQGDAVREAFQRLGLKCIDCVAGEKESLFHAALYHEKDLEIILTELNRLQIPLPKNESFPS